MKKLLIFGVTALGLFGASFGVSSYLQRAKIMPLGERLAGAEGSGGKAADNKAKPGTPTAPADAARGAVRPPYTPGTDEAVQLASSLRERLSSVRDKEKKLSDQERQLDLIIKDIRGERAALDELRKQISEELKAVTDKMSAVERRQNEVQQQRQDISKNVDEMQKRLLELEGVEKKNFDKMASMYDSMAPESAAKILQHLADSGKIDTAVKLLGQMKERNAAKVLAELSEPSLAAQFLERLKGLKRPAPATTAAPPAPAPPPPPAPESLPLPVGVPTKP